MPHFVVDPDISKARTLATEFYTSPDYFEEAKEKIFANSWQFIVDIALVREPGECIPFILLEKFLDEPLVLTSDKEGKRHLLSNVCTHRGNLVVNEPCRVSNLRCRYHGRQFRLDGQFVSMPEFKEVKDFPTAADNLPRLPLHRWGPWLFTSLNQEYSQELFLRDMQQRLHWLPVDECVFEPSLSKDYVVKAHWALYCENYLEGFHIPFVHAGLNAVIDFGNYTTELFPGSNLQLGIAKDDEAVFDLPESSVDFGKRVAAYYFFVFPNMMFNFYPWGLSINIVQPLSLQSCKVSFLSYVWKKEKLNMGAGSDLDTVELEDEEVVEAVQLGIRSRFYKHGRYSVTREQGTHHFHRMIAAFMK